MTSTTTYDIAALLDSVKTDCLVQFTLSSGSSVSVTRLSGDLWQDDQSGNQLPTDKFLTTLKGWSEDILSTAVTKTGPAFIDTAEKFEKYLRSQGDYTILADLVKIFSPGTNYTKNSSYKVSIFSSDANSLGSTCTDANIAAVDGIISKIDSIKAEIFADLSQSQKITSTKMKNRLIAFRKMLEVGRTLLNSNDPLDTDILSFDHDFNQDREHFPLDLSYLYSALTTKNQQVIVNAKYGFDLAAANVDQYKSIIAENSDWSDLVDYLDDAYLPMVAKFVAKYTDSYLSPSTIKEIKKQATNKKFYEKAKKADAGGLVPRHNPNGKGFPDKWFGNHIDKTISTIAKYVLSTENDEYTNTPNPEELKPLYLHLYDLIPDGAYQAALVAANGSEHAARAIISNMLISGVWNAPDARVYKIESGQYKGVSIPLLPGMAVYKYTSDDNVYAFVPKFVQKGAKVFGFYPGGSAYLFTTWNWSDSFISSWKEIVPSQIHLEFSDLAMTGNPGYSKSQWDDLEAIEKNFIQRDLTGDEILSLKEALGGRCTVSSLSPYVRALIISDPANLDLILYKNKWGHYDSVEFNAWNHFVAGNLLFKGLSNPDNETAVNEFVRDCDFDKTVAGMGALGIDNNYEDDDVLGAKFALREGLLGWSAREAQKEALGLDTGIYSKMYQVSDQHFGGGQKKLYYVDIDGNLYMGKPNTSAKFRPDAEYAANRIAAMYGYSVPESAIREIDGHYMYLQRIIPDVEYDLDYKNYSTLDETLLINALRAHPLHWSISNHDLHGGNFLVSSNKTLYTTDLGQAWKALGNDTLSVGWKLAGNYGGVWYENFYRQVQAGKVDAVLLNKITKSVLSRARLISTKREESYLAILEEAFQHREVYPEHFDREAFIGLALHRKTSTYNDFLEFYKALYSVGGYSFDFEDKDFASTRLAGTDAHLSLDESFAEQVKKNGVFGKSLFFKNSCVEDAHALFHMIKRDKGDAVHIDMKIRPEGDKILVKWINANKSKEAIGETTWVAPVAPKKPNGPQPLPYGAADVTNAIIVYAKNVNFHHEDGSYNMDKRNYAKSVLDALTPDSYSFTTVAQEEAWKAWHNNIVGAFNVIEDARTNNKKCPMVDVDYTYTEPEIKEVKPKPAPKPKVDKKFFVVEKDFSTLMTSEADATGSAVYVRDLVLEYSKAYYITDPSRPDFIIQYVTHEQAGECGSHDNYTNIGRLQIEVLNWDYTSNKLQAAFDMLGEMGLTLEEADDLSLQLFFWRHLRGIMGSRKLNSAESSVLVTLKDIPETNNEHELSLLKSGFASLWGADVVEQANWRPQFSDLRAHFLEPLEDPQDRIKSGRPYWIRPDFSIKDYMEWTSGVLPSRHEGNNVTYLVHGGYIANEDKIRFTGKWGLRSFSASSDRIKGSSQYAFVHQGIIMGRDGGNATGFYLEPHIVARTHNYAFEGDRYGYTPARVMQSPFNLQASVSYGYGHSLGAGFPDNKGTGDSANELMIKYGWSTWDDIAIIQTVHDSERQTIIDFYKSKGIEEIRGIPVEDRVVSSTSQAKKTMKKIWALYV